MILEWFRCFRIYHFTFSISFDEYSRNTFCLVFGFCFAVCVKYFCDESSKNSSQWHVMVLPSMVALAQSFTHIFLDSLVASISDCILLDACQFMYDCSCPFYSICRSVE
mmetsp:Transcript_16060/g.26942  ORF Transcript_16060/g.26942 Transcript_16060/m.26942 type:complete len:109 (+) Transcript_16060:769-1095(+)